MRKLIAALMICSAGSIALAQNGYDNIGKFGKQREGWALVSKDGLYGFIDESGIEVVPPAYDFIGKFGAHGREDWALVSRNGLYGFIDRNGIEVVPLKYDMIDKFKKKRAIVHKNGRQGIIDADGIEIVSVS